MQMEELVNSEGCWIQLDLPPQYRERFRKQNPVESFGRVANRFLNQLVRAGILERDWTSSPHYRVTPEGMATLTTFTTSEAIATAEFVQTVQDNELRARADFVVLRGGKPDSLLREAATVLEDRLRSFIPGVKVDRRGVAAKVLHPKTGKVKLPFDETLQEDLFYLIKGILGFYGSEIHHGLPDLDQRTVTRIVAAIDEILVVLPAPPAKS